ncbi:hypothetical protein CP532_5423 [Ophiocordyceps camponoti-leonardi (nom. inval.)]|nr:hypothetical protein CP532_5423 [Ophiocordyceps camponoti-leonardi (nom. inval.)]
MTSTPQRESVSAPRNFSTSKAGWKRRHVAAAINSPRATTSEQVEKESEKDSTSNTKATTRRSWREDDDGTGSTSDGHDSPTVGATTKKWWSKPPSDPRDTTQLVAHWDHVDAYYRDKLKLLRVGVDAAAGGVADGRGGEAAAAAAAGGGSYFNIDDIAKLHVRLDVVTEKVEGAPNDTNPSSSPSKNAEANTDKPHLLRDLAHIVPKGKTAFVLLVHDVQNVEPIQLALQNSHLKQKSTRSEDDPRQLTVRLEPDRLDAPITRVKMLYQRWIHDVRVVRAKQEKLIKSMLRQGTLLKDDFHKAKALLQKLQEQKIDGLNHEEKARSLTAKFHLTLRSS